MGGSPKQGVVPLGSVEENTNVSFFFNIYFID